MNPLLKVESLFPAGRKVAHVEELAPMIGTSKDAVLDGIRRKEIKATKFGRRYLIPLSEVQRLLSEVQSVAVA